MSGLLYWLSAIPGLYWPVAFVTARRVRVRGHSMEPELLPGDRVLFDRLVYRRCAPAAGDIVLARHPARPGVRMVKRVSAPPDGRSLAPGECWLLGDAPDFSTDSRQLGPFRRRDIAGRAWFVYWPPERARRLR